MAKSTVYFTKEITPEAVLKMYRQLGVELPGKVAVKVHMLYLFGIFSYGHT